MADCRINERAAYVFAETSLLLSEIVKTVFEGSIMRLHEREQFRDAV